jgi:hypothetical protein
VTAGEIALADPGAESATITAVGGDLRVSTPHVAQALEDARHVLVAQELPADARRLVLAAAAHAAVVDLTGTLGGRPFDVRDPGRPAGLPPGLHASPAGGSLLVAALARAARRAGAGAALTAVVLEPVSELGADALDEMFRQAMATLRFQPPPTEVLGRQVVHDVGSPGTGGVSREARLREEVAALLGGQAPALLRVQAGTFHGVAVAVHADVDPARWRAEVGAEPRLVLTTEAGVASPVQVVQREAAVVGRLEADPSGGAWAWAAADTLRHGSVGNVVEALAGMVSSDA